MPTYDYRTSGRYSDPCLIVLGSAQKNGEMLSPVRT